MTSFFFYLYLITFFEIWNFLYLIFLKELKSGTFLLCLSVYNYDSTYHSISMVKIG